MRRSNIEVIRSVFKDIADSVTPTMGARGRLAVIQDEFSRPILTDDGVTVAKEMLHLDDPFERMVAKSMIEAAHNTEKAAFDGTTLTLLLTHELYELGLRWIEEGLHPQEAADKLVELLKGVRLKLGEQRIPLTKDMVYDLANITTKIPLVAELLREAYDYSKGSMRVIVEHDRVGTDHVVNHIDGMVIDAGYMSESLKQLCNEEDKSSFKDAHLVLLAEGMVTNAELNAFFDSIPDDRIKSPYVFFVPKSFNPESLKLILDTLVENKMRFQIVFINDSRPEEVFLDLAAFTGGRIQDSSQGTTKYLFSDCGVASKIVIEQDKTTIIPKEVDKDEVNKRVASYQKELTNKKYNTSIIREHQLNERLGNLTSGVTKISIAVPTITEFLTLKLKLDDGIGAIRCAIEDGVVIGAGKALFNIADRFDEVEKVLKAPYYKILDNAGLVPSKKVQKYNRIGTNVKTKEEADLLKMGIIDSFKSIDTALENSLSIASSYLRAYILIIKDKKEQGQ